jgi:DNA-binding LacI/PurR family transcriptional regulator
MGVVEIAHRRGLRLPDDLSVVGFDDIRFASHMEPPLTTIAQPMREIGVTLLHRLVVRSSTAPRTSIAHRNSRP